MIVSAFNMQVNAQACGTNGSGVCTPTGGPQNGGFEPASSTPCAEQGTAYNHAIQFTMFDAFNFQGQQTVDSVEFVSIENLPCGMCWAVNKTNKRYAAYEDGCLNISGTTTDAVGQYKMNLTLKAWINGQTQALTIPSSLVDQTGIKLLIRVKSAGGTCANADTSANANNLTATAGGCPNAIRELSSGVSSISIIPNPMTNNAVLSFIAQDNADYTVRVTDITGKMVSVKQVQGRVGENKVTVERGSLPAGVYFVSLTDGKNAVTQRFSITD